MVYISIPYVPENKRIDKNLIKNSIELLEINEDAKQNIYEAIFNRKPRGVDCKGIDMKVIDELQVTLRELGIPYRRLEESDY